MVVKLRYKISKQLSDQMFVYLHQGYDMKLFRIRDRILCLLGKNNSNECVNNSLK